MSDVPERIAVWPDFVGHPSMTGQWSANTHPDNAVAYVRADLSDALLREAMAVLHQYISDMRYPPERDSRDRRIAWAQATLAKLRAHMGEDK